VPGRLPRFEVGWYSRWTLSLFNPLSRYSDREPHSAMLLPLIFCENGFQEARKYKNRFLIDDVDTLSTFCPTLYDHAGFVNRSTSPGMSTSRKCDMHV